MHDNELLYVTNIMVYSEQNLKKMILERGKLEISILENDKITIKPLFNEKSITIQHEPDYPSIVELGVLSNHSETYEDVMLQLRLYEKYNINTWIDNKLIFTKHKLYNECIKQKEFTDLFIKLFEHEIYYDSEGDFVVKGKDILSFSKHKILELDIYDNR